MLFLSEKTQNLFQIYSFIEMFYCREGGRGLFSFSYLEKMLPSINKYLLVVIEQYFLYPSILEM